MPYKDPKAARAQRRRWAEANPEKMREYRAAWTERNAERDKTRRDEYRAEHRDERIEYNRRYRTENAEEIRLRRLAQRYGITVEWLEERLPLGCAICGVADGEGSGVKNRLHVDHDHATGVARGLLCHSCNTGIGSLRDDPKLVIAAVRYLKGS
jgi:hypothetical protein